MNRKNDEQQNEKLDLARRRKHDDFDDLNPVGEESEEGFEEFYDEDEDEDEEVDFDNPSFKHGQIWNDYADDLDFDE